LSLWHVLRCRHNQLALILSNRGDEIMSNDKQRSGADEKAKQNSGNFAQDPQRASEAGRKGGQHSHGGSGQANQSGSGRSQEGAVQSDETDDSEDAGKAGGNSSRRR
jgi:general stress protein YciG